MVDLGVARGRAPVTRLLRSAVVGGLIVIGCAQQPRPPANLDESIRKGVADSGFGPAVQLVRTACGVRTCVVIAKPDETHGEIALLVFESEPPFRWQATGTSRTGVEPGTFTFIETDETVFVYGRINDDRITSIALPVANGELEFSVLGPAYAVAYPAENGIPQGWRFLDAAGQQISGSDPDP